MNFLSNRNLQCCSRCTNIRNHMKAPMAEPKVQMESENLFPSQNSTGNWRVTCTGLRGLSEIQFHEKIRSFSVCNHKHSTQITYQSPSLRQGRYFYMAWLPGLTRYLFAVNFYMPSNCPEGGRDRQTEKIPVQRSLREWSCKLT